LASEATTLVLGRGELYFAPFDTGQLSASGGEIYIGNTPEFVTGREVDTQDAFDSFDGQKMQVEGAIIREKHTARFTTDHIAMQNLALWYGKDPDPVVQARAVGLSETHVVRRGRYYQLGATLARPFGIRGIESVSISVAGDVVPAATNFEVDKTQGRIHILSDATDIMDGATAIISFERRDMSSLVATSSRRELFGSLRYVGRNPVGPNKNYFYPVVKLTPTGDIDHKAADWQRMSFEVDAQRRNPLMQYVYIDEIRSTGPTVLEYAIIEAGITLEAFPFWEDRLDRIVNVRMPAHNYHS
jgi:hypothetical protein